MNNDVEREEVHLRRIALRFYRRRDGLYEIEGNLVDTKSHPFRVRLAEADTAPGVPVHDILVRLVIDADMVVHDAQASMPATPFAVCSGARDTLQPLIGLRIGAGWNRRVRELLAGAASCTHIMELLGPMATTAFQGLAPERMDSLNQPGNEAARAGKVNSCYAYSEEREVVARLWPELHKAKPRQDG